MPRVGTGEIGYAWVGITIFSDMWICFGNVLWVEAQIVGEMGIN